MNETSIRDEICRIGASLYASGYVHGSAGNISVKLEDGSFLITPTDACLGHLHPNELAHVNAQGQPINSARASKTLVLHRHIYSAQPQAQCVIHTHATYLVSLTLEGVWRQSCILPPLTPYFVMKVGQIPLVNYARPGAPEVAAQVSALIKESIVLHQPIQGVMLDRLGPVVWHQDLTRASATLEELEETARLWLMSNRLAPILTEAQIQELRDHFHAIW